MSISIRIEVQHPTGTVEHTFKKPLLRLGRDESADLVLQDESIDGHHAQISVAKSEVTIADQGSKAGTFVNGASIDTARVFPGDKVRLGGVQMKVFYDPKSKGGLLSRLFGK